MAGEVDPLDRGQRAVAHRRRQQARLAGDREDGPVVIGIGMDVEQPRIERRPDRLDRGGVAALRDVRNREERSHGGDRTDVCVG